MKNLNSYGEEFINEVLNFERLEDENIYKEINNISVTESNTSYLINLVIKEKSEQIYIYNKDKYKYNSYKLFFCDEIFTISKKLNEEKKQELINNFCNDMFSNYYNFYYEDISEDDFYLTSDLSENKIKYLLENEIL